ncbi:TetR/AcrR family transcriptional regulator [Hymenobacter jeollabukensis]|uniref:TetR/AcrR family transcriptional regulator n=1 Tax=Hymenobacter jeollabukensis TaxID=2025313 RepID=A0A5R8WNA2_9BACT|nr:TetR/AcrR family transcriptional regulator [Hymenobacter jeollabukensis]TLM91227.1 TetR/AcrR family transcriptional regulator [Hymenobacter jeollabukensis]
MLTTKKTIRRQFILDEAAKLFKEKGYGGTSMRDLAGNVGLEAASMYNYIKSKDEILELICQRIAGIYISQLAEIEQTPQATYAAKVEALIRLHIRLMVEEGPAVSVANHDWKYLPEPQLTAFKQARKSYEQGFARLIEQGVAAGEFQALHPSVALFTILSAVRWVELWYRPGRELSAEELENDIVAMLLSGLAK